MKFEYFEKLLSVKMISEGWRGILSVIAGELACASNDAFTKKYGASPALAIFASYFSLIDDGNVYMTLDAESLDAKFSKKIDDVRVQMDELEKDSTILDEIYDEFKSALACLPDLGGLTLLQENGLFVIEENKLFTRKFFNAKENILDRFGVLFKANVAKDSTFDYKTITRVGFELSSEQEEVARKGFYNNLFVTGGPGTGKTTSIFFMLLPLLMDNPEMNVYLAAPSGKAASRMKESILSSVNLLDESKVAAIASGTSDVTGAIEKIKSLNEHTIHRLLGVDYNNGGFKHNKNNQFDENSIFVIDEASMIDVVIFASLLEAIPDGARVFILGDKDQLPSVEVGAVFAELLARASSDNKVYLKSSQRFPNDSEIFKLAQAVNNGDALPVSETDWKDVKDFEIEDAASAAPPRKNPIYYYSDDFTGFSAKTNSQKEKAMIEKVSSAWYEKYFATLQASCKDLKTDETLKDALRNIFTTLDDSRILCANNIGMRGVTDINKLLIKKFFDEKDKISGFYPGEPLMITENHRELDLYNGDNGVAVTFASDDTLYIVFKKATSLTVDSEYVKNQIFTLGDYVFYPARLIGRDYITSAFAITIHKSQGSDYNNILVILPKMKGHPLLNRQIVYTAITRTKGSTYILSNQENLEAASQNVIERDTFW